MKQVKWQLQQAARRSWWPSWCENKRRQGGRKTVEPVIRGSVDVINSTQWRYRHVLHLLLGSASDSKAQHFLPLKFIAMALRMPLVDLVHRAFLFGLVGIGAGGIYLGFQVHNDVLDRGKGAPVSCN